MEGPSHVAPTLAVLELVCDLPRCLWMACIDRGRRKDRTNLVADDTEHHCICWLRQNKTQDHSLKFVRCGERERNTTGVLSFMCQASKCARAAKM